MHVDVPIPVSNRINFLVQELFLGFSMAELKAMASVTRSVTLVIKVNQVTQLISWFKVRLFT